MTNPPHLLYPKLSELPTDPVLPILALDCHALLAPRGPIPIPTARHHPSADLSAALLAEIRPDRIILPLFGGPSDALTIIEHLEALGYAGRIFVLAPPLPRPALVERELRAAGPGTRLVLVTP